MEKRRGFTLIEILVVIILLGFLAVLISGSYVKALQRSRDTKRKSDLSQIQRAIEFYYEDQRAYPTPGAFPFGGPLLNTAGAPGKTYMTKVPSDPTSTYTYVYESNASGTYYRIYSCIENEEDRGLGVAQKGFSGGTTCGSCGVCKYLLSSPNITPLPTLP